MGVSVGVHAGLVSRRTHVVLSSRGCHASLRPHHMVRSAGQKKTTILFQIKRRKRRRKRRRRRRVRKSRGRRQRRRRRRQRRRRRRRRLRRPRRTSLHAQNTNTTMYKFSPQLSDQFTSAHSRARRGTGVWGPSLSWAQRAARGGTCPAWHRQASDQDQRPHRAPDLRKNKK